MSILQFVLILNIVLQAALFLISAKKLGIQKYYRKTIPWLFPFGAYVWDDMLPISVFWLVSSLALFLINDLKSTLILILIFFAIRSFYEVLYWFFQQFHTDNTRPFDFGLKNLPNQNIYIIYQVANLCQTVLALFALFEVLTKF